MFRRRAIAVLTSVGLMTASIVVGGATTAGAAGPLAVVPPGPGGLSNFVRDLPNADAGQPYSFQMQATGGVAPYTWERIDGTPPPGITFSSSGLWSGTPLLQQEAHTYSYGEVVRVTDSAVPPSSVNFTTSFTILPLPFRLLTTSLPTGAVGVPYAAQVVAAGGNLPFQYQRASKFPRGLRMSKTGIISGVPKRGGSFVVVVTVRDSLRQQRVTTGTITLTIEGGSGSSGPTNVKPVIAASGHVQCSGALNMKAAMSGSGTGYFVISKFKGTLGCAGTTGNAAVSVTQVKVNGAFSHSGSCTVGGTHSNDFPTRTFFSPLSLVWKSRGGVMLPSSVRYSNHNGSAFGWQLPAATPAGTAIVSGSYDGNASSAVISSAGVTTMEQHCGQVPAKVTIPATITLTL